MTGITDTELTAKYERHIQGLKDEISSLAGEQKRQLDDILSFSIDTLRILKSKDADVAKVYRYGNVLTMYDYMLAIRDLGFPVPLLAMNAPEPPFFGPSDGLRSMVDKTFPDVTLALDKVKPEESSQGFYLTSFMRIVHDARRDKPLSDEFVTMPALASFYDRARKSFI